MSVTTFGRRNHPCEDCMDGYCTMNCGPSANGSDMAALDNLGQRAWDAINRATKEGKNEIRELGRFIDGLLHSDNPCLRSVATQKPCEPDTKNLRRCTICGFVVSLHYAAERPLK